MPRHDRPGGRRTIRALLVALVALLLPGDRTVASAVPRATAADTLVVVVSAESPLTEMSNNHLVDIYLGRATRFSDGRQAIPLDQENGSPRRDRFYAEFLGRSPADVKAHWSKLIFTGRGRPPQKLSGDEAVRQRVAEDSSAIGYIDISAVDASVRVLRIDG